MAEHSNRRDDHFGVRPQSPFWLASFENERDVKAILGRAILIR